MIGSAGRGNTVAFAVSLSGCIAADSRGRCGLHSWAHAATSMRGQSDIGCTRPCSFPTGAKGNGGLRRGLARTHRTDPSTGDRRHPCTSRSRGGSQAWRAMPGLCDSRSVARDATLPDRHGGPSRSSTRTRADNRRHRCGPLSSRAFPASARCRVPNRCRRCRPFLRAGSGLDSAPNAVLRGIQLYIGDGAALVRGIIRRRQRTRIGHTPILGQLDWCARQGIRTAIFTHCGSAIVGGDERRRSVGSSLGAAPACVPRSPMTG